MKPRPPGGWGVIRAFPLWGGGGLELRLREGKAGPGTQPRWTIKLFCSDDSSECVGGSRGEGVAALKEHLKCGGQK